MRRRTILAWTSTAVGSGLAGCLLGDGGQGADTPADDGSPSPDDSNGSPSPEKPSSSTIEVVDSTCGSSENVASVSFGDGAITIEGSIEGSNACVEPEIADVYLDQGLIISIETVQPDDVEGCAQCISDIAYEARFDFDGTLPTTVVVEHDGQTVTRTQR